MIFPDGRRQRKEKELFTKCSFFTFKNRLVRAGLSQGALLKTTTFAERTWNMSLASPTFHFSMTSFLHWTWKLEKFLKKTAFCAPLSQKRSNGFSSLKCYRPCRCQKICHFLAYLHVLFWSWKAKYAKNIQKFENLT